ncbi:hypothetical protein B9G53_24230 [Pseudanabaena sp. SR411]|nr:hypothetical protein B9G53_24230 [Pseudanabaena sp. SR411]
MIRVKTCKIAIKAMHREDFKNMLFAFRVKKLTVECAFVTCFAGFYTVPASIPTIACTGSYLWFDGSHEYPPSVLEK